MIEYTEHTSLVGVQKAKGIISEYTIPFEVYIACNTGKENPLICIQKQKYSMNLVQYYIADLTNTDKFDLFLADENHFFLISCINRLLSSLSGGNNKVDFLGLACIENPNDSLFWTLWFHKNNKFLEISISDCSPNLPFSSIRYLDNICYAKEYDFLHEMNLHSYDKYFWCGTRNMEWIAEHGKVEFNGIIINSVNTNSKTTHILKNKNLQYCAEFEFIQLAREFIYKKEMFYISFL